MRGPASVEPLSHPGPATGERLIAAVTRSVPATVELRPGARLVDALVASVLERGVDSAQVALLGGTLDRVDYCVPAACLDGSLAASYSATRTARGPVSIVGGSVTVGRRDGAPFVHCHAAWLDAAGVLQAGHIWPDTTIGRVPVGAALHPLPGVHHRNADDLETGLPVFTPWPAPDRRAALVPPDVATGRRAVVARALPGENLREAAERMCALGGLRRGVLRASLGSLVGPTFPEGVATEVIPGPCTELISAVGEFGPDAEHTVPLHALVVDSRGAVHGGTIDPERSPVAVTAELLIIELDS